MIAYWPDSLQRRPRRGTWTGGPKDSRRAFQPDSGGPIMRPSTTADVMLYPGVVFPNFTAEMRTVFETWWQNDIARGSLPFCWREPESDVLGLWLIQPGQAGDIAYSFASKGAGLSDLTLTMIRKPGTPWFAPYLETASAKPPYVVADYANGVFGVNCRRVAASVVAAVSGTFDLVTTITGSPTLYEPAKVISAGDIPSTAPMGVSQIVGFEP